MTGEQIYMQIVELKKLEAEFVEELKRLRKNCMTDQATNWEQDIDKDPRRPVQVLYKELVDNIRRPLKDALDTIYWMGTNLAPHQLSPPAIITQLEAEITRFKNKAECAFPKDALINYETLRHWLDLLSGNNQP